MLSKTRNRKRTSCWGKLLLKEDQGLAGQELPHSNLRNVFRRQRQGDLDSQQRSCFLNFETTLRFRNRAAVDIFLSRYVCWTLSWSLDTRICHFSSVRSKSEESGWTHVKRYTESLVSWALELFYEGLCPLTFSSLPIYFLRQKE